MGDKELKEVADKIRKWAVFFDKYSQKGVDTAPNSYNDINHVNKETNFDMSIQQLG